MALFGYPVEQTLRKEYDKRASRIMIRDFRIHYFGDEKNAAVLAKSVNGTPTLAGYLEAHLNRLNEGEYFALLAYIDMNEAHERVLQEIRQGVRDIRRG
jgi:hypothetical protein